MANYDAIIVLGGGRQEDGRLTPLSLQRLDKGAELYFSKKANKILVMGGHHNIYDKNRWAKDLPYFSKSAATIRKEYLISKNVSSKDIVTLHHSVSTIEEAFVSRSETRRRGWRKFIIVTSDKHLPRALWIFRRIYGPNYIFKGIRAPCGDLLNSAHEKECFLATKKFFAKFPKEIPDTDLRTWYQDHPELYADYKRIHDKYYPTSHPECQAYMGIRSK